MSGLVEGNILETHKRNIETVKLIREKLTEKEFIDFINIVTKSCPYDIYQEYYCSNECGNCFSKFMKEVNN